MSVFPAVRPAVTPAVRGAFEQSYGGGSVALIKSLFAAGQQGFWLPFTDFASLSQDSAGTLPYTALEQPVGRVLDRSGRGNHASQPTSTARGVVSARVNWFTTSTDFSAPYWVFDEIASPTLGSTIKLAPTTTSAPNHRVRSGSILVLGPSLLRMECKADGMGWVKVRFASWAANFNLATGAVGAITGAGATASARVLPDGFVECSLSVPDAPSGISYAYPMPTDSAGLDASPFAGDGVAGILLRNPDRRFASQAGLPYQRVNTSTDYDAIGFPKSLRVAVDDFYTCGGGGSTTGFYYSDVVRPMGGAGTGRFLMSDRIGGFTGYMLALTAANKLELALGGGGIYTRCTSTDSIDVGTQYFIEAFDDGVNLQVAVNGGTPVTVPRPATPTYGGSAIMLYKNTIGNDSIYNGQITEPIYRAGPPPSAYERGVIRAYQMQKAGR